MNIERPPYNIEVAKERQGFTAAEFNRRDAKTAENNGKEFNHKEPKEHRGTARA